MQTRIFKLFEFSEKYMLKWVKITLYHINLKIILKLQSVKVLKITSYSKLNGLIVANLKLMLKSAKIEKSTLYSKSIQRGYKNIYNLKNT